MFNMISSSGAIKAGVRMVTEDDFNESSYRITCLVYKDIRKRSLICIEMRKELEKAVVTVHSEWVTTQDDIELCH